MTYKEYLKNEDIPPNTPQKGFSININNREIFIITARKKASKKMIFEIIKTLFNPPENYVLNVRDYTVIKRMITPSTLTVKTTDSGYEFYAIESPLMSVHIPHNELPENKLEIYIL